MDTIKTASSVGLGIIIGGVGLVAIPFVACCGISMVGASVPPAPPIVNVDGERVARLEISNIQAAAIETNSTWTKYSYQFDVQNNGAPTQETFEVRLLNAAGLIIDKDTLYGEDMQAGTNTARGTMLVSSRNRDRDAVAQVQVTSK